MLEAFFQALLNFTNPWFLLVMLGAVIIGLVLGVLPGIGVLTGMILFLPFAFRIDPMVALTFMVAMHAIGVTGGSITAILLNIPGDGPNAATLIDGFPMTQKGQGARAIGAAVTASGMGGLIPVFMALAMVPLVLPLVLGITSAEMVFIILIGLSLISLLGRGAAIKALISGMLGLLVSLIGFQAVTAIPRFVFGTSYLYDGIPLIPVALGLFAMPEAINLAMKGGTIVESLGAVVIEMRDTFEGIKDVFRHLRVWFVSTVIGYIVGIIPGVGAMVAVFIAYGQARQTSKHPEEFGTGRVEGVIAPEAANNAKEAGALLTTLALGIPGSASMVVLLGGFILVGLVPGPGMLTEHLELSLTLLMSIAVANVMASAICILTASQFAKVALIPARILFPLILIISVVAAYVYHEEPLDIIMVLIFTALGLAMRRFGYNRPALLLGYVLGFLFEENFFTALHTLGPFFFLRPASLALIFVLIAFLNYQAISRAFGRLLKKRGKES